MSEGGVRCGSSWDSLRTVSESGERIGDFAHSGAESTSPWGPAWAEVGEGEGSEVFGEFVDSPGEENSGAAVREFAFQRTNAPPRIRALEAIHHLTREEGRVFMGSGFPFYQDTSVLPGRVKFHEP